MNPLEKTERVKKVLDTFGRLSFVLETAVKLEETGDFKSLKEQCYSLSYTLANDLANDLALLDLNKSEYVNE